MSVLQLFTNNAVSLLHAPLDVSGISIQLQPGAGAAFPQPSLPGEFFLVTLESIANPLQREIIKIIARAGDTLIIDVTGRGQEGTTPQGWSTDTLVDHRITAETIRQAFLQPPPSNIPGPQGPPGVDGQVGPQGPQGIPGQDAIAGTGSIAGSNMAPVIVDPLFTNNVSTPIIYSTLKRGHKFWVTLFNAASGQAQTFEILSIVQGVIGSGLEQVTWTRTNRIGYNFLGSINIILDLPNNTLSLSWTNNEPLLPVTVTVAHLSL